MIYLGSQSEILKTMPFKDKSCVVPNALQGLLHYALRTSHRYCV